MNKNRFGLLYSLAISFLIISFITRLVLMFMDINEVDLGVITLLQTFLVGFFYDFIAIFYYFIPLVIYLFIIPTKIYNSKIHKIILYLIAGTTLFVMLFNGVSEYFFWEEFGKRFNFIAVDYLVYTHEVLHNIQESYPLPIILSGIFAISLMIVIYFRKQFFVQEDKTEYLDRLKISGVLLLAPILIFNLFDKQGLSDVSKNIYNNELAKNGTYSLFSAFRHNEMRYSEFYKTIDNREVFANLKKLENFDDKTPKIINNPPKEKKKNVILIMVESLSAEYMGIYGNKKNLTPYLDKLTQKSLFFNNLFATGTRTVRGMEAVTLSVPPTAGRSIVKRPINNSLDSIGDVFSDNGYENRFIYAGHGYFDNMNNFFSKNGFSIVDRLDFKDDEVTFSNAWGVCDEDLLNKVSQEADKSFKAKKPFFSFVMTTSNHRPYTYPDNKIDIPSHTGRDGAVKYTDFAIGKFLEKAKTKPWFNDTIFVIIADHNGGSAGKNALPLYRYKIPLIIYSPSNIKPQTITKLSSQIDTMPTLFNLLGISYKKKFYGNNILDEKFKERAFIGNYQKLGYVKNGYLYYLTPDKKVHKMRIDKLSLNNVNYKEDNNISSREKEDIITYYQSASLLYEESK
ncbi:Sulfatase family protein [hydrothermal vent metagenome]|uniref:Sulfatase family protein n=1 Tax=hydrothermal vent metagenome TaxID=652676 RepID=A0A1W1C8P6_9ZZZZ